MGKLYNSEFIIKRLNRFFYYFFVKKFVSKRNHFLLFLIFLLIMSHLALALQHLHQMRLANERDTSLATRRIETFLSELRHEITFLNKSEETENVSTAPTSSFLPSSLVYDYKNVELHVKSGDGDHCLTFFVSDKNGVRKELRLNRARLVSYLGVEGVREGAPDGPSSTQGKPMVFSLSKGKTFTFYVRERSFFSTFFKEKKQEFLILLGSHLLFFLSFYAGRLRGFFLARQKFKGRDAHQTRQIETLTQENTALSRKCQLHEENTSLLSLKTKKEKDTQEEIRKRNALSLEKISVQASIVESSLLNPSLFDEKECLSLLSEISSGAASLRNGLSRQTLCEETPLEGILDDVVSMLQYDAHKAHVSLQSATLSREIWARTDPLLLTLALAYLVKKSLSVLYEGRVIVSLSEKDDVPLIRVIQEGEGVHEDRLFTNHKLTIAGVVLDERLMEALCQRLCLRVVKVSPLETHLFVGESDALPEKRTPHIYESSPNVIPLFS